MSFVLASRENTAVFYLAEEEFKGVKRVAGWVASDIEKVAGIKPDIRCIDCNAAGKENSEAEIADKCKTSGKFCVVAGTLGKSSLIEKAVNRLGISVEKISGKREVYGIFLFDNELVVVGSDKRGTIYGLLKISEAIGVTPFVFWGDVTPRKFERIYFSKDKDSVGDFELTAAIECISKEPSVKYRGFFINDEWPAFGNWANKHFNGVNADCYAVIFEYLLRMKGNYMWPAMWASCFSVDGPGTLSAELADELGVVMGTSHHEPCMRAGEEFVRQNVGHTEYGKAWSFVTNREGITKFWEDGLERGKDFENVITVGMRGERDSKLFEDAKLIDNINVLKNVITCQKELINRIVKRGDESKDIPMMLAIYKEVEQYYKGDAETEGLKEWEGLDGITLMLCDDNFANLRLVPEESKRNHKGGYGMYYHFDYHGGPISYEWISSSYLPKVWDQMTMAYDSGIRDIWIVNVGDLKFQELPLSYFLDLAYDFDKYGTSHPGNYDTYLHEWIAKQFNGLDADTIDRIAEVQEGYMRLNNIVKPETLNENTYSLTSFAEADRILDVVIDLEKKADDLLASITSPFFHDAYVSIVYFQAKATFNLIEMQIISGKNKLFASQGRVSANSCANAVAECIEMDKKLVDFFHIFNDEKWYSMAKSKHIGFRNWNDEGCRMPVRQYIEPVSGAEMIVTDDDSVAFSVGGDWCRRPVRLTGFDYKGFGSFSICNCGREVLKYEIICDNSDIEFEPEKTGETKTDAHFKVKAGKNLVPGTYKFRVKTNAGFVDLFFEKKPETAKITDDEKIFTIDGFASIGACDYYSFEDSSEGSFREIPLYGRILPGEVSGAVKAYPQEKIFGDNGPMVEYKLAASKAGEHVLTFYTAPSNPSFVDSKIRFAVQINDGSRMIIESVDDRFEGGESSCGAWNQAVLTQIRKIDCSVSLNEGVNSIKVYAVEPQFVLEKIVVREKNFRLPDTYLGPVRFMV